MRNLWIWSDLVFLLKKILYIVFLQQKVDPISKIIRMWEHFWVQITGLRGPPSKVGLEPLLYRPESHYYNWFVRLVYHWTKKRHDTKGLHCGIAGFVIPKVFKKPFLLPLISLQIFLASDLDETKQRGLSFLWWQKCTCKQYLMERLLKAAPNMT